VHALTASDLPGVSTVRGSVKVRIDSTQCTGHGRCYALAPDVFAPDDTGYGTVLVGDVPAELEAQARMGEQNCPERAITIEEDAP
jgi:ferredoxin